MVALLKSHTLKSANHYNILYFVHSPPYRGGSRGDFTSSDPRAPEPAEKQTAEHDDRTP